MRHHHITRVLYIAMVATILSTGLVIFAYSQTLPAKAASPVLPFVPYAGTDEGIWTPAESFEGDLEAMATAGVNEALCPDYILMQNDDINVENPWPEFGLFIIPGGEADTYDYQTLDIPETTHIGGYGLIPNAACGLTDGGVGGPVFPIYLDTEADGVYFLDGGTLSPQLPVTE